ncbi:apoptosis facilitator Bcl-2-like protein 14 isoform X2 [Carcharodon carcharias]|uniref:apoptosis facilitator Bcl-2-like protein 14 isoform X2 n=1 Tax=Carcharodon carcharias TaxID=13397 RepID=UPI001B7EDA97|nr:apoptosis facilitator Bcl-2-like protein 14 isoform X2 [Carcharodon carcharias]
MESLPEASVNGCLAPTESVLSMNMRGLKPRRVVEVYIKRSLSLREDGARNKELKWQSLPAKIPQRNINHREGPGLTVPATYGRLRERESQAPGTQTAPPVSNSSSVEPCAVKEAGRGRSKDGKKGKKSQTFLGKIASFLWRRKGDEKKDEGCKRSKEFGSPQAERPSEENREQLDSQEAPEELATAHKSKSKRKNSLRRVFSFKRNNSEVKGFGSGGPGANKSKAVRPTRLDLGDVCRPKPGKTVDNSIYKIIEILQKVGDDVDTELQGDSLLSTFFKDISYNSFKELADQYIEHEVRSKVTQENPDFVKFAFTLDFTAKVAGICDHQVKRITGFGSQYLQETCWQLPSFSEQQETANNIEKIPSPD